MTDFLWPEGCTCSLFASPMDYAALGHMTTCPLYVDTERQKAIDELVRKGFAVRVNGPDEFLLTELGRDAADHARMIARGQ